MKTRCVKGHVLVARIILAVAVCLIMVVLSGAAIVADVRQVTLLLREFKFEPPTIQLKVGEEALLPSKKECRES